MISEENNNIKSLRSLRENLNSGEVKMKYFK
jgi:hypothetical protein